MIRITDKAVLPDDFCVANDLLWLCTAYYSSIIKADLEKGDIRYETELEKVCADGGTKYCSLLLCDNKIISVPRYSKNFLIFDVDGKEARRVENISLRMNGGRFAQALLNGEKVYCIPEKYPKIVVFDARMERIIKEIEIDNWEPDSFGISCECGDTIIIPNTKKDIIYELSTKTNTFVKYQTGTGTTWREIIEWSNNYYLRSEDDQLYRCMKDYSNITPIGRLKGRLFSTKNRLWNVDKEANAIYELSDMGKKDTVNIDSCWQILLAQQQGETLYVIAQRNESMSLFELDMNTGTHSMICQFSLESLFINSFKDGMVMKEMDDFVGGDLNEFISCVSATH